MAESLPDEDPFGSKNFLNNKTEIAVLSVFFIGLFLLAVGAGLYFFKNQKGSSDIQIISADAAGTPSGEIIVHIDGAVKSPGLYKLPSASRVNDAVIAAGGLSQEANTTKLNLAAKVADGQKVHIASFNDPGSSGSNNSNDPGSSDLITSALIDINSASEAELDRLPGVGPVTAQKIIAGRPYSSKEELVSKKAVSSSVFEKIKEMIRD